MLDLKYSSILKVAIPLMVSSFIQSIVLLTDAAFLSRYSNDAFDASGNAGLIYVTLFIGLAGFSDGVQILIARRIGQKKEDKISSRIKGYNSNNDICFVVPQQLYCCKRMYPLNIGSLSPEPQSRRWN
jgi:hypothetical protein